MNKRSLAAECNGSYYDNVDADPDIAGIGVLVAFGASAWITLLFCVTYYCINPAISFIDHVGQDAPVHPIDKLCLDKLDALWTRIGRRPSDKWAGALEKAVLGFSDQQCITGIAILLSGYSQLSLRNTTPITVYNWQIAVDLAWFSSITHLTTLTCLRHYFRQRRALSNFRIACMAANAVILAVSIGSTGWQLASQRVPALCLFDTNAAKTSTGVYNGLYTAIAAIFLAFSYLTRIIQICPENSPIRRWFNNSVSFPMAVSVRLRAFIEERVPQPSKRLLSVHRLVYRLVLTVHYVLQAVFDLYRSMLWEITWLLIALAWGSLRVITDRLGVNVGGSVLSPGNRWGFGQVIAIILLFLPFISFFEVVYDTIFLHRTSSLSANPAITINTTALSGNAQHNSTADQDRYRHRWLRMVILLLYGLSLAVAADLLYMFPYEESVVTTVSDATYLKVLGSWTDSRALTIHYAKWFSINIVLLGAFTFLVISVPDGDSRLRIHSIGHQVLLVFTRPVGRRPPASALTEPEKAWIVTLSLYITIAGILAGSLAYDWRWTRHYIANQGEGAYTSSDGQSSCSSLYDADSETEFALLELERNAQGHETPHGNHHNASAGLNSIIQHPCRRPREFDVSNFEDYLRNAGPFATSSPFTSTEVSFKTLFEIVRVALHGDIPYSELMSSVKHEPADYEALWSPLSLVVKTSGRSMPERSDSETWYRTDRYEEGVACSGKLKLDAQYGQPLLSLQLNPLIFREPNRFTRKYGWGRIFELDVPCFSYKQLPPAMGKNLEATRSVFNNWIFETNHLFLGREWRAFFSKPNKPKEDLHHNNETTYSNRVYLFAERGHDIPASDEMSVNRIVEWFVPAQKNAENTVLKLFYRISQGLTPTSATTIFQSDQIIRTHDAFSKRPSQRCLEFDSHHERRLQAGVGESQNESFGNVMNDGCARISRKAHEAVAEKLGLQRPFPSVYQGRIAGAKGTWMKDPIGETTRLGDPFWIEITDSQFIFETSSDEDALHRTLEVIQYSRPLSSARINTHLVSILIDRGVPLDVLEVLMRESMNSEVARFEAAMEDALEMRKWIQEHNGNSIIEGRLMHQSIKVTGAVPSSIPERIIWFLEHGFEPRRCQELGKLCRMELTLLLETHVRKLKIRVGQSASAFVIADPLGVLEENEIHVGFSGSFVDEASGFQETFLDGREVLVARHPAVLPSDIQKARAVFHKDLAEIKDVFIFSVRGSRPLVSLLSGGDHDGDMPWLCWDERVVRPFENVETPSERSAQYYNIPVDQEKVSEMINRPEFVSKFLRKGLEFNSQPDFLGMAAKYHEALCYYRNSISDESTIDLGCLLGLLVDFRKGGLSFTIKIFEDWKINHKLHKLLEPPCYKSWDEPPKISNCLDKLAFQTVKSIRDRALEDFDKTFKDTGSYDSDLSELWKSEEQRWESWARKELSSQFENLKSFHHENCLLESIQSGHETKNENRAAALDQLRDMFLQIQPPAEKPHGMISDSDAKAAWQRLKASFLYYKHHHGPLVWHACGEELGELKIDACGGGKRVVNRLHLAYKADVKLIKQLYRTIDE